MDTHYILIKDAKIINEGKSFFGGLLIKDNLIHKIYTGSNYPDPPPACLIINAENKVLIPGLIDDQVHFRDPGLTHKADINSESKAAIAGGITSFMDMPNTIPRATSIEILEEKYKIGAKQSLANYSFYLGATNNNIKEIKKINPENVCGLKVFMGSSTGNMLVDNNKSLEDIFKYSPVLIAVHCEDENIIRKNTELFRSKYGDNIPMNKHPEIRSAEACYKSSSFAVSLAKKFKSHLHLIHLSSEIELELLENAVPLKDKRITSEVCVHYLWFCDKDYDKFGAKIKWNPAIKKEKDRDALITALNNDLLDIIATDHAPHSIEEKQFDIPDNEKSYFKTPSGGPLIQHSLNLMLELWKQNKIELEKVVEKMCHNPADIFRIRKRGYIKEGYYADLALINTNHDWEVKKDNILYKCKWSPIEGQKLSTKVTHTFVNGKLIYENGIFHDKHRGQRLLFDRIGNE